MSGSDMVKRGIRMGGLFMVAALVLAGCKEKDLILPGERHSIRPQEQLNMVANPVGIALGTPQSNANWAQKNFGADHVAPHVALAANPTLRWSVDIGRGDSDRSRITSEPVVAGGVVYAMDAGGHITAVSAQDHAVLWQIDVTPISDGDGAQGFGGGLALDGATLYAGTGFGELLSIDAASGAIGWRYGFDAPVRSAPTVAGGRIFLVTRDDIAYAVDRRGSLVWNIAGPEASGARVLGGASIAVRGQNVVVPFSSGRVYGVSVSGAVRWMVDVNQSALSTVRGTIGEISGDPVIAGGRVIVANQGGQTVGLNLNTGIQSWSVPRGALGPAAVIGGSAFVVSNDNQLLRINASNGAVIWATQLPEYKKPEKRKGYIFHYGPIVAGGQVIVAGTDGQMRFFDPASGGLTGAQAIPGGAASAPVVAGGVLYVQSRNGKLLAFQ